MATQVRLLQALGRPVGPTTLKGTEVKVGDDEAERMIAGGIAERIETAEKRGRKPKGAGKATSRKAETAEKRTAQADK